MQLWSGFILVNGGDRIYPTLTAISPIPTLHFAQFKASSFSKPTLKIAHLLHLCLPYLLWSSLLPLALHFKLQCFFSKDAHHPSPTHAQTISLHSPLPFEPLFPFMPTSPLGLLSSFSPSILHHTLLSPWLSRSFSKFPSHFPSNTMAHSHITSPISHNSDKSFLSS